MPSDALDSFERQVLPQVNEDRLEKLRKIVDKRCGSIHVATEGLFDLGNVNAVMRTAEGLGYLHFHLISNGDKFRIANRVTQGADKWLKLSHYSSASEAITSWKSSGLKIAVTDLDTSHDLLDMDLQKPWVLVFGSEKNGVSQELKNAADLKVKIPMDGFVQSFNISVAAAICLSTLKNKKLSIFNQFGDLSEIEKKALFKSYVLNSVTHPEIQKKIFES